jgi:predicted dehydrogenase
MVAAADAAERLFMVSQNRRYMPELIAFRDTVARLGRLSELTCDFFIAHRERAAEFLFAFPQPLLLDMAIHLFDGARAITGADPLSVYCDAYNPPYSWYDGPRRRARGLPDVRRAALRLLGQLGGRRVRDLVDGLVARGRRARLGDLGGRPRGARVEPGPGKTITASVPILIPPSEIRFKGLAASLAEFVSALRTGTTPQGEAHDNIQSLAMCHAAVASAELGAPVPVTAFTSGAGLGVHAA